MSSGKQRNARTKKLLLLFALIFPRIFRSISRTTTSSSGTPESLRAMIILLENVGFCFDDDSTGVKAKRVDDDLRSVRRF